MEITIIGFCLGFLLLLIPIYILHVYKVNFLYKILRGVIKLKLKKSLESFGRFGIFLYLCLK